ncbi:MAG: NfeD family protein [Thermoplasmatota archaeon]
MVDLSDPTTVGYGLMSLGVLLLIVELLSPGFFIAVPATVLIILGVFALNAPFDLFTKWAPLVVIVVGVPATLFTIVAYRKFAPPTEAPTTMSGDALVGKEATVTRVVEPGSSKGKVRIGRMEWSATSDSATIAEGAKVRVSRVEGVVLHVESDPAPAPP